MMWYVTEGHVGDYDKYDMDSPFLSVHGADALERPKLFCDAPIDLNFSVAATLLKIKFLIDLRTLQNSKLLGGKVPPRTA